MISVALEAATKMLVSDARFISASRPGVPRRPFRPARSRSAVSTDPVFVGISHLLDPFASSSIPSSVHELNDRGLALCVWLHAPSVKPYGDTVPEPGQAPAGHTKRGGPISSVQDHEIDHRSDIYLMLDLMGMEAPDLWLGCHHLSGLQVCACRRAPGLVGHRRLYRGDRDPGLRIEARSLGDWPLKHLCTATVIAQFHGPMRHRLKVGRPDKADRET